MYKKHLFNWNYNVPLLLHPEEGEDTGGEVGDIDSLDDDNKEESQEEEDDKETNEDENEEVDEDEDKEEDKDDKEKEDEDTEEEEELNAAVPDYNAIKKSFPELFKKFPDLKTALVRDQKYSEVFATPEEASTAAKDAGTLRAIETDLLVKGDPTNLLAVIKKNNAESFNKVSLSILPYLQENDKDLYYKVASLPIKQLLRSAWREGKGKETDLGRAAAYIHKHFFGDTNVEAKLDLEDKKTESKSKAQEEYEAKLAELDGREFNNFKASVDTSYVSSMDKLIREGLDKDERINDYMKSKLVEDILLSIRKDLDSDTRFSNQVKSLWSSAKASNYSSEAKKKILNTVLARAKAMVPTKRSKVVSDALKTKKANSNSEDKDKIRDKKVTSFESGRRAGGGTKSTNNQPNKPLSDMDILRG